MTAGPTPINEDVAGSIRARMARANVSQYELARRTGIPRSTIGVICRGSVPITVDVLAAIAAALGEDPRRFLPAREVAPV